MTRLSPAPCWMSHREQTGEDPTCTRACCYLQFSLSSCFRPTGEGLTSVIRLKLRGALLSPRLPTGLPNK